MHTQDTVFVQILVNLYLYIHALHNTHFHKSKTLQFFLHSYPHTDLATSYPPSNFRDQIFTFNINKTLHPHSALPPHLSMIISIVC